MRTDTGCRWVPGTWALRLQGRCVFFSASRQYWGGITIYQNENTAVEHSTFRAGPARIELPGGYIGYLTHKKTPTPYDRYRVLGIVLLQGPRGVRFLISEVPLYTHAPRQTHFFL